MRQLSFEDAPAIDCDGETFDPALDAQRLGKQMLGVLRCLKRGGWWTLQQLRDEAGGSEAGVRRETARPEEAALREARD